MKKATRNLLIVALIFILIGGILGITGYSLGGLTSVTLTKWGPVLVDMPDGSIVVEERWGTLKGLDIKTDVMGLRLKEGKNFSLGGSYNPDLIDLEVSVDGGILTIRGKNRDDSWLGFDILLFNFGDFQSRRELVLTYPKGTKFQVVSIDNDMGALEITDLTTDHLNISLNTGSFKGSNITTDILDVDLNLGSCKVDDLTVTENAEVKMGAGSLYLDLKLAEKDLNYNINSDLGSIRLNGKTLRAPAQSGTNTSKPMLNIDSNLGSVRIRTD
jgi:hypothetical protein